MNLLQKTTNILVVGIGGQGVMTASEILAEAAIAQGCDVKKTEVAGMSQRGGVVSSHVRFGRQVLSPEIAPGEADILVGFEVAEAMRWSHYLRPRDEQGGRRGGAAMINRLRLAPPIVSLGLFDYPDDPVAAVRGQGFEVHDFDAGGIARELGDPRLVNSIMLGAISGDLPFPAETLKACVVNRFAARKPELAALNARAFDLGKAAGRKESA
ncbi:MAG: indolepyruvate oxidoreductase subunit beta [Candidatus Accumulibacter sp.]|jgi:indolepyruvate ferredoxin oxidoreductase beta subunit|nr:indolepyruvate oxidoreductase subunit beta [Accumulibacter sp.]